MAQVHCDEKGCLNGSYAFSQYIVGVGYIVDWKAQRDFEIALGVKTFFKQAQAVADALHIPLDVLLAWQNLDSSNPLPKLQGGNWNFFLPKEAKIPPGCTSPGRCGSFPSLDFKPGGFVHLDTVNPWFLIPVGAIVHGIVDFLGGHTIFAGGIPR